VSIQKTEAAAEQIEEALVRTLAAVLGCDEGDVRVRVAGPRLAEFQGRWNVAMSFEPGSDGAAGSAGDDEPVPAADIDEGSAGTERYEAPDEVEVGVDAQAAQRPADAATDAGEQDTAPSEADRSGGPDDEAGVPRDDAGDTVGEEPEPADAGGSPVAAVAAPADDVVDALEEEAEAAADFIEGLLDALDLPGDLRIRYDVDHAEVEVVDVGSGALIGRRGQTLEAIQELLRCSLQREFQRRARVKVDVEGYRSRRLEKLLEKADEAIDAVLDTGEPERLEPMDVFERKAVHHRVAEVGGLVSRSQGREPARRIIIERD
jgi:spoIIIJ-associated protein